MTASPPLSVQLYTVRDQLAVDPAGTLERLREIGFTTVELFAISDFLPVYTDLALYGLRASSAHAPLVDADVVPVFEAAQAIGVSTLIHPMTDASRWTTGDDIAEIAHELNRVAAIAADIGITIGYHNHWWELESRVDGTTGLEVLADLLDPGIVLEVDTYWAAVGGVDPVALLERLGSRVQLVHVKDGALTTNNLDQVAVGAGRMPVPEVLAAAPHAVRVVELDQFAGDMFTAVADSAEYLIARGERF